MQAIISYGHCDCVVYLHPLLVEDYNTLATSYVQYLCSATQVVVV